MALAGVHDGEPGYLTAGFQHVTGWFNAPSGQGDVVAHGIHVAARSAEVVLPVNEEQGRVTGNDVAVVGPFVWVGGNCSSHGVLLRK